jgi:hypothetical protein
MADVQGVTVTKTGEQGAFGGERKAHGGQAPPAVTPPLIRSVEPGMYGCGGPAKPGHAEKFL